MARPNLTHALLVLPALVAAGCSCNQDYSFPEANVAEPAPPPPNYGSWLSMSTAPDGQRLTITYYDREQSGIGFAVGTPQSDGGIEWVHERVDGYPVDGFDAGDRGKYTAHVVAPDGRVWAAYQDSDNGVLRYAVREGPGVWNADLVDAGEGITSTNAGTWVSMALQDDGNPIVAHHDEEAGTLRVSWWADGSWSSEVAYGASDDAGEYSSIAVHDGTVYIAFYDAVNGNLGLVEGTPGSWQFSEVDLTGDVGQWPSVHADENGVSIAYQDVGNQDLKFATRQGGSWAIQTIDDGEFRGADTDLFMLGGNPAIVYFDGQDNDMWLATSDGAGWSTRKIGGDNGAVGFHNEVARIGDATYVGSYDFTAESLFLTTVQ